MKKYYLGIIIFILLIMTTGCKKTIVGKWKAVDSETEYYYIFNKNQTCSYEMTVARLDCTYEIDGTKLNILYKGNDKVTKYEYQYEDNTLTIIDDTGKEYKFTKVKK